MYELFKVIALVACFYTIKRFIYPPVAAILMIWFGLYNTVGTAYAAPYLVPMLVWPVFIVATLKSYRRLWLGRNKSLEMRWAWRFGTLAVAAVCWGLLSRAAGGGLLEITVAENIERPMAIIIALAYLNERKARFLFLSTVIVQVLLALALIVDPYGFLGIFVAKINSVGTEHVMAMFEKTGQAEGSRFGAQFVNTIGVSFYGSLAVAIGVWGGGLRSWTRVGVLSLIPIGVYLLLVSSTRGVLLGLVFGLLVYLLNARGLLRLGVLSIVAAVIGVILIEISKTAEMPQVFSGIVHRFSMLNEFSRMEEFRIEGNLAAWQALLAQPLFGFGSWTLTVKALHNVSHVGPLYDLSIYGLPFAIATSLFLFCAVAADVFGLKNLRHRKSINSWRDQRELSSMFGWILVATVLTNGYIGIPTVGSIVLVVAMRPVLLWLGQRTVSVVVPNNELGIHDY